MTRPVVLAALLVALVALPLSAQPGDGTRVGTSFPAGFPEIIDHSLDVPVIGFGSDVGPVERRPVIFLHGNNDTPYPTDCNGAFGNIQQFAQHFLDHGYNPSELWGLGYQGDQCDLLTDPPQRSGEAHSTLANVPDLRAFVAAVLRYTGAAQVDIVGHSLGTTLAREWMRQDGAHGTVHRLVGVDGPNHGIINCSPNPRNYWQAPALGAFTPNNAICVEYGAHDTPFLTTLNADPAPAPTEYLMIHNADVSFVFVEAQDGTVPPVPAENRRGEPWDFSRSATLDGAEHVAVTGQGEHDDALRTAHLGIVNSPEVWALAFDYLFETPAQGQLGQPASQPGTPPPPEPAPALPATGGGPVLLAWGAVLLGLMCTSRLLATVTRPMMTAWLEPASRRMSSGGPSTARSTRRWAAKGRSTTRR